jgi:hypothetical protein
MEATMKHLLMILAIVLMTMLITFILMNIVMGCDSWENPACITPVEMLKAAF